MAQKRPAILYPSSADVETFHDTLIRQSGNPGHIWREKVQSSIDWARTEVYNFVPFPGMLNQASAILYAYIIFHPFIDGNKRTALMTTSFFFFINGYSFRITDDSPEFTKGVAEEGANAGTTPQGEIIRIGKWLRPNVSRPILMDVLYRNIRSDLPPEAGLVSLVNHPSWDRYYQIWRLSTTERFRHLLGKWPGLPHH
jgi:death-on-curing family protein